MYSPIEKRKTFCLFSCLLIVLSIYILYTTSTGMPVSFSPANRFRGQPLLRVLTDKKKDVKKFSAQQDGLLNSSVFSLVNVEQKRGKLNGLQRNKFVKQINPQYEISNESADRSDSHINASTPVIQVGFFEGARYRWNYGLIFQPPTSPRTCECKNNESKFQAVVTLEKNATRTGKYELLFIPHDVSISRMKNNVWDMILSSASPHQKRVYATFEGAWKLRGLANSLAVPYRRRAFHWSLTHHSNSDFAQPYGYFKPLSISNRSLKNWAEGRNGLIAWMSTWSDTSWKLRTFVENLQKHIPVHMYGIKNRQCPRNSKLCEEKMRGYKFYLALENSCCGEYITEKFWRTLSWDIVPVVLGAMREEYERLAPPHSFIYIDDFSSMEDLANYLLLLHKNDDLYNQYFSWKGTGEIYLNYPPLQEKPVRSKTPPDGFFYSCSAVCRVSKKYLSLEKSRDWQKSTDGTYFDPNVDWWCGSCGKCGQHDWIRGFNNYGTVDEDASIVAFLLSEDSSYVAGNTIIPSGGIAYGRCL